MKSIQSIKRMVACLLLMHLAVTLFAQIRNSYTVNVTNRSSQTLTVVFRIREHSPQEGGSYVYKLKPFGPNVTGATILQTNPTKRITKIGYAAVTQGTELTADLKKSLNYIDIPLSSDGMAIEIDNNTPSKTAASATPNTAAKTTGSTASKTTEQTVAQYLKSSAYLTLESAKALMKDPSGDGNPEQLPNIIVNNQGAFILDNRLVDDTEKDGLDEFFAMDNSVIYPGQLVYINDNLSKGNPTPCNFATGTVTLTFETALPSDVVPYATVANDKAHVQEQINKWLAHYMPEFTGGASTYYFNNTSHMAATLKCDASFLANKAKVNMSTSSDKMKIIKVEDYTQNFFTVSAQIDNDLSKHIGSATTTKQLQNAVSNYGPIGMITRVSYGRRAYRFREYTSDDFKFDGSESVSVSIGKASGSVSSTQNIDNSTKSSRFWSYIQGGNAGDQEIFNSTNDTNDDTNQFMATLNKTAYNPGLGVPLSYTVRFLGNGQAAKHMVTSKYYETEYTPCYKNVNVTIKKHATQVLASYMDLRIDYKVIHVIKDAWGNVVSHEIWNYNKLTGKNKAKNGFADYMHWSMDKGDTQKKRVLPTDDLPDPDNCYVMRDMKYELTYNNSAGGKHKSLENTFSLKSDDMTIHIDGSNYAGKSLKVSFDFE